MIMGKSAYELRMEMLQMAKDYMEQQYNYNFSFAKDSFDMAVNTGKATMDEWQKYAPAFYDFSDVLKKAEELYSFVNKKETK